MDWRYLKIRNSRKTLRISKSVLRSTVLEPGAEDEDPVDFNKTIAEEVDAGAMETKREFLTKFLGSIGFSKSQEFWKERMS